MVVVFVGLFVSLLGDVSFIFIVVILVGIF